MAVSIGYAALISFGLTAFSIVTSVVPAFVGNNAPMNTNIESTDLKKLIYNFSLEDSIPYKGYFDYANFLKSVTVKQKFNNRHNTTVIDYSNIRNTSILGEINYTKAKLENNVDEKNNQSGSETDQCNLRVVDRKKNETYLFMSIIAFHEGKLLDSNRNLFCYYKLENPQLNYSDDLSWYLPLKSEWSPNAITWYLVRQLALEQKNTMDLDTFNNFTKPEDFSCLTIRNQETNGFLKDLNQSDSLLNVYLIQIPNSVFNFLDDHYNLSKSFMFNNSANKNLCTFHEINFSSEYHNQYSFISNILKDDKHNDINSVTKTENLFLFYFNLFIISAFLFGPVVFFMGVKYFLE